jgi:hypothetical protein
MVDSTQGRQEIESALSQEPLSKIEAALDQAKFGCTLCFIADDQIAKLSELIEDLKKGGFSRTGDGKQFGSGFSYWGIA